MTLEEREIISQHFPVQLFTDELLSVVVLVLLFSGIVDVTVEVDEFMPFFDILSHMICILLSDVQEAVFTCEIIQHDGSSDFIE